MTLRRTIVYIIFGLIFLAIGLVVGLRNRENTVPGILISDDQWVITEPLFDDMTGSPRPEFSLPDIHGRPRFVSEWDGKVILVNFWATWCLPCLKEIPELLALQEEYGELGLQVIGIALQKPEDVTDFVAEHQMTYPVMAGEADVIVIAESYGNRAGALPYSAIIDRHGDIAFTKAGSITKDEVENLLLDLLM
jgi:thiol-disulfide isomerase/thioredoxin